jgi:membrane protein implicated in regulation of membrane protease activity
MLNFIELFKKFVSTHLQNDRQISNQPSPLAETDHEALVLETIEPGKTGRVKFQGSWWAARSTQPFKLIPGQTVYVIGRWNITLGHL